ncbi:MAG TPA: ArsA-related P-loop ATPase [Thermoleophilaceae bacterium]|nr:ArsA-related P-loop ATPase [Thermoleophilaceae bacterium]
MTARATTIDGVLAGKRVVVCAGSGGVGKTTTAAAIAAALAARGQRVIVLTIDPARRLADALGLPAVGNAECRVDQERLAAAGLGGDGELWAMTLDAKRTFDELVERNAPDAETRDAVLSNPIYRQLSNAVAGSQEYMAMEKLYELHGSGRYDVVVLDTPPARNALDFLDAPGRLSRFIDSRSLQVFRASGRAGLGLFGRGIGAVMSILERATGVDLLRDLAAFFNAFGGMAEGFRDRARRVEALLCEDTTTFLLVTSPRAAAIADALHFHGKLDSSRMPFGALIVNRVRAPVDARADDTELEAELNALLGEALARKVRHDLEDRNRLAERDARNIELMRVDLSGGELLAVPELSGDVHDLDGLAAVAERLFERA